MSSLELRPDTEEPRQGNFMPGFFRPINHERNGPEGIRCNKYTIALMNYLIGEDREAGLAGDLGHHFRLVVNDLVPPQAGGKIPAALDEDVEVI